MNVKILGAVFIIVGCGGFGFSMAYESKREELLLNQLLQIINYMERELQYRLTPLPDLCLSAANETTGIIRQKLLLLSAQLNRQLMPDASSCMNYVLSSGRELPQKPRRIMRVLGNSLGKYDLPGQLSGLESAKNLCSCLIEELGRNRDDRLRSYRTLGLCAGAALAIILI